MGKIYLDDICRYLKENDFRCLSIQGSSKQIWINDNNTLTVIIKEHIEEMAPEDEERIKKRLKELGYLD